MHFAMLGQALLLLAALAEASPVAVEREHARSTLESRLTYLQQAQQAEAGRNSGWTAMGCIKDSPRRTLSGEYVSWSNMTLPICMNYCFSRSYTYGGVQYGSECWCGNEINKGTFWGIPPDQWINWGDSYGTLVDYSECQTFPCAGDPSTSCGNHWRNNVFMVTDKAAASSAIASSASASASSAAASASSASAASFSSSAAAYSSSSFAAYASRAAAYSASVGAAYSTSASAYSASSLSASVAAASASASAFTASSRSASASAASASSLSASAAAYSSSSLSASAAAYSASSVSASAAAYSASSLSASAASVSASASAYSASSRSASAAAYSASSLSASAAAYSASSLSASAAAYSASSVSASAAAYSASSLSASAAAYSASSLSASAAAASSSASAYSASSRSASAAAYSASSLSASAAAYSASSLSASAAAYSASSLSASAAASSASSLAASAAAYSASSLSVSAAAYSASSLSASAAAYSASSLSASAAAYSSAVAASASASAYSASSLSASAAAYSASSLSASAAAYSASSASAAAAQATAVPTSWSAAKTACVAEGTSGRALTGPSFASPDMSYGRCIKYCNDAGFGLAGVEYSTECYCGNVLENGASLSRASSSCDMKCGGSDSICGGPSALTLFVSNALASTLSGDLTSKPIAMENGWENAPAPCVQEGTSGRALTGASFADDSMTPTVCMSFCLSKNFKLAGVEYGRECYCGNELTNGASYDRVSLTCTMGCAGNPSVLCGGSNGLQLYYNPTVNAGQAAAAASASSAAQAAASSAAAALQAKLPAGWRAASTLCIQEVSGRALTAASISGNDMTVDKCVSYCSNSGYSLAGLEFGGECFCHNSLQNGASLDKVSNACTMACNGDSTTTCGGPDAIQLYTGVPTPTAAPATPTGPQPATDLPAGWTAAATNCIQEVAGRALPDYVESSNDMTINKCINICGGRGFKLAGVEYGGECWCSNALANGASLDLVSGQCVMPCAGDAKVLCGGPNAIQLYANPNATPTATSSASASSSPAPAGPTPAANLPAGWSAASTPCLQEVAGRALAGYSTSQPDMTIPKCLALCQDKGFHYAGVQYGSECFCGAGLSNGASLDQASQQCTMGCAGDATSLCGGPNAIQLYENPSLAPSATSLGGFVAKGCIQEVVGRALNATSTSAADMTVGQCVAFCKNAGYAMAGVEYGEECYCGNALVNGATTSLISYECKMPCAGNSQQLCGGPDAINLYASA